MKVFVEIEDGSVLDLGVKRAWIAVRTDEDRLFAIALPSGPAIDPGLLTRELKKIIALIEDGVTP